MSGTIETALVAVAAAKTREFQLAGRVTSGPNLMAVFLLTSWRTQLCLSPLPPIND